MKEDSVRDATARGSAMRTGVGDDVPGSRAHSDSFRRSARLHGARLRRLQIAFERAAQFVVPIVAPAFEESGTAQPEAARRKQFLMLHFPSALAA